jgi:hypothetical protein
MRARNRCAPKRSTSLRKKTTRKLERARVEQTRKKFLSSTPPSFLNENTRELKKNYERTDANNAAVVAAVTAALESFSDKLDAWTVLLTELF